MNESVRDRIARVMLMAGQGDVPTEYAWQAQPEEVQEELLEQADAVLAAFPMLGGREMSVAERVSMEVLDEYRRIASWLEAQSAVRGAAGDTMHGLAAEALTNLIDREYSRHAIPLYAMLDVWMALYGTSHPEFDEFYERHGYAATWSMLTARVRALLAELAEFRAREATGVTDSMVEAGAKAVHERLMRAFEMEYPWEKIDHDYREVLTAEARAVLEAVYGKAEA